MADPNTGNIQQTVNERSFGTRGSWSAGFDKAKVDDDGVVVGPDPATVFARFIAVNPGDHYRIAARAVSADHKRAIGTIQVNWFDKQNTLIYSTISKFELGNAEKKHSIVVKAPSRAAYGTLYVAPGRPNESVRYREMSISPVNFYTDFYKYTELQVEFFFGIIASALAFIALAILARRMLPARANAIFSGIIDVLHRRFYIFSVILIPSLLLFLEQQYEMDFDSHWHQNWIERIIRWSDVAIDVGPGILHNFGIRLPINPLLSPTFYLASFVPQDIRVPVQATFQALILFGLVRYVLRRSGIESGRASATALITVGLCWVPSLSSGLLPTNAMAGLLWQDPAIATLLAFIFFAQIGQTADGVQKFLLPTFGLFCVIFWVLIAYSELMPFFMLATASICLGALVAAADRRELYTKFVATAIILVGFLAIGAGRFLIYLFEYTPQTYFKTTYLSDFEFFMRTTSLLLRSLHFELFHMPIHYCPVNSRTDSAGC